MSKELPLVELRDAIVRLAAPETILLVSRKEAVDGSLTAVKLCVVIGEGDPDAVERRLYMDIDSDLPYDVLVYTRGEWDRLAEDAASGERGTRVTAVCFSTGWKSRHGICWPPGSSWSKGSVWISPASTASSAWKRRSKPTCSIGPGCCPTGTT